ncbi:MAG: potassium channel family protein [Syntrophales bacterium]
MVAGLLILTLFAGTAGYILIEGWAPFDALYMTVITLATVGYGETNPSPSRGVYSPCFSSWAASASSPMRFRRSPPSSCRGSCPLCSKGGVWKRRSRSFRAITSSAV